MFGINRPQCHLGVKRRMKTRKLLNHHGQLRKIARENKKHPSDWVLLFGKKELKWRKNQKKRKKIRRKKKQVRLKPKAKEDGRNLQPGKKKRRRNKKILITLGQPPKQEVGQNWEKLHFHGIRNKLNQTQLVQVKKSRSLNRKKCQNKRAFGQRRRLLFKTRKKKAQLIYFKGNHPTISLNHDIPSDLEISQSKN